MPVTRRHGRGRNDGCWTCKLRRKKCDEVQPTCGDCDSLEITCVYGLKPRWMETEEKQRQKATLLKKEIKNKAALRREKLNTSTNQDAQEDTIHQFNIIPDIVVSKDPSSIDVVGSVLPNEHASASTSISTFATISAPFPFSLLPSDLQYHHYSHTVEPLSPIEADFISKYIDFVFPALFPFYRPSLFDTGRSWLRQLLGKSHIAHHAALSISCYFFTMALVDMEGTSGEHANCRLLRWDEVEQHTQNCFDNLRTSMIALDLNTQGIGEIARVEALENIVHLLIFEMALCKATPWNSHLPPAYALLSEIMACDRSSHEIHRQSKMTSVLLGIELPLWTNPADGTHIWSPAQAGFRFCAALLIFIDIMASIALQESPTLLPYHAELLAERDDGISLPSDAEIHLSTIIGCRNGIMRSIAETSMLDTWKKEQVATDSLNVMDLVDRASHIAQSLKSDVFEYQNGNITRSVPDSRALGPLDIASNTLASSKSTLIWAHAAQLYLTVVVSGWQLSNPDIRTNVAQIIALLEDVPPYQLRALVWPICVAGCLALEEEEPFFLRLFAGLGKVHTAGALDDARQIMEKVWRRRGMLGTTNWDLASCFSILGSPILLV
ncbi:hypothetical protein BDW02DRAFT_137015 [Decorospora gaudefroyi]|uniref:Zn(2)-C6 fungal-type domain-containing protein n=1 Tax=Decorospora gaudefroyi TaxID=184978 RepID=A0A6A5K598_9PLEO|nr:hypothetical protein BDW02DRAFT_137015 [Decorospora gaudefroyi]